MIQNIEEIEKNIAPFLTGNVIPPDLRFDDESIDVETGSFANVVADWKNNGKVDDNSIGALAAVLIRKPDLIFSDTNHKDCIQSLKKALNNCAEKSTPRVSNYDNILQAAENNFNHELIKIFNNILKDGHLLHLLGKIEEKSEQKLKDAEKFYYKALQLAEKIFGLMDIERMSVMSDLAELLKNMGKKQEYKRMERKIKRINDCKLFLVEGTYDCLIKLRYKAYTFFKTQKYKDAKEVYKWLLNRKFQIASTHFNLARVLSLDGKYSEANEELKMAWNNGHLAYKYVPPRILFLQSMYSFKDKKNPSEYILKLKKILLAKNALSIWSGNRYHENDGILFLWTFNPILEHFKENLASEEFEFLSTLGKVLNEQIEFFNQLNNFPIWADAEVM